MNDGFHTDMNEVFARFVDLTSTEMSKVVRGAVTAGAKELKKQTVQNLNSSIIQRGRSAGKYNDSITDAVRLTKMEKRYDEAASIGVHIMGSRAKGSGTYRARFLEKGTQDRYAKTLHGVKLKKPRYTGRIAGKYFFKSANQSVTPELESIYTQVIEKAINKINKTKV